MKRIGAARGGLGAVVGAAGSTIAFLTTLSFMLSTPGVGEVSVGGFPALSVNGQFLLKDLVLLAASLFLLGDALTARRGRARDMA